jgi:23S rRNA (adenine2503-C2)-methyltransferase
LGDLAVIRQKAVYFFSHFESLLLKYVQRYEFFVGKQNKMTNFAAVFSKKGRMDGNKRALIGLTLGELKTAVTELGMPGFTAGQIMKWLYQQHVRSIDEMTNISKVNREKLAEHFEVGAMEPLDCQRSKDGTIKYLFPVRTSDDANTGKFVETVFIPDHDRATLCVSCQVGCKMNCLFCQTGKQGFEGQLTAADILNQIYALPEREQLTNIVFMGQGEPMDNLDAVLRATEILTANEGYAWSPRRITVSSVGVKNKLKRFLDESECHVAISMHSPLPEQRQMLMPAERQMSIEETVALLRQYDFSHQRRCSFEYICFGGLNDTQMHAREIIRLLQGLDCRVNLIRFHEIPSVDLPGSDEKRMEVLRDYLTAHGVFTTIRASRGQDIFAACGLLSTAKKVKG